MNLILLQIKKGIWILFFTALIFSACSPARKFPENRYLIRSNKIDIIPETVKKSDISPYIKQKPNRKQLGTWLRVRIYNGTDRGKQTGVKRWIKNTFGQQPVILDTSLTLASVKQMEMYLMNKGYFYSTVSYDYKFLKKRKQVIVYYHVRPTVPYKIREVRYTIPDAALKAFVYAEKAGSLIKPGENYDVDKLAAERDRITSSLNDNGYYYFTSDFIRYKIDSTVGNRQVDVTVEILEPLLPSKENPDSLVPVKHRRYLINRVYIVPDYNVKLTDTLKNDTLKVWVPNRRKGGPPKAYYFVYHNKLKIKPKTLTQQIFIDSNDYYCYKDVEKTHKQLYELKTFRFVNLRFSEVKDTSANPNRIDCQILLSRLPVQAFAVEAQVTNRGGDLGIAGNIIYENRNIFRGAENLTLRFNGAVEIEKLSFNTKKEDRALKNIPFFNTVEAGTELNIRFPRFLLPVRQERFSKNFRPKTNLGMGFNYQQRPDYTRYISRLSFGYEWKESAYKTHIIVPLELNSVIIHPDSSFAALIEALTDRTAKNAYKNHLITSMKYSFVYNTQQFGKKQDFMYFRGNFEIAGFIFWMYNVIKGNQGSYSFMEIPYSQYTRVDVNYSYYHFFNDNNILAFRTVFGIGAPLDKYNTLPFEKSFYLGGANSMRGWRLRQLGPGSYDEPDSLNLDNIGDLGLEGNLEYRFPIYKYFKGCFFVDAGNIWLRRKNELFPNGEFQFKRFYKELAFDAGLGLRLDFNFLVIRLDGAVPLKNPRMPEGSRWIFQKNHRLRILGNFGIGYPF